MRKPFGAPPPAALKILEDVLPVIQEARAMGWEINLAIEWCDGESFTISGRLPLKPSRANG